MSQLCHHKVRAALVWCLNLIIELAIVSIIHVQNIVNDERAVPICSNLGNRINCGMINRRIMFRWEQIMEAVLRMTNLFKDFLSCIFHILAPSNLKRLVFEPLFDGYQTIAGQIWTIINCVGEVIQKF